MRLRGLLADGSEILCRGAIAKRAAAPRRSIKAGIIALAVLAGIVAGAVLVYTPLGDQLLTFLGFTYPKDCG